MKDKDIKNKKMEMNHRWDIQRASLNDAPMIAQFQVDMALESEGTELNIELVLKGVSEGINDESKGIYLVARNGNNEIIGSLLITREWSDWRCTWYWWIQSVYVCPEYRRQGVYREMYYKVKILAQDAQVHCLKLYADRNNKTALSTYTSLGMKESHYLLFEEEI